MPSDKQPLFIKYLTTLESRLAERETMKDSLEDPKISEWEYPLIDIMTWREMRDYENQKILPAKKASIKKLVKLARKNFKPQENVEDKAVHEKVTQEMNEFFTKIYLNLFLNISSGQQRFAGRFQDIGVNLINEKKIIDFTSNYLDKTFDYNIQKEASLTCVLRMLGD